MTYFLISFPSAAMVLTEEEFPDVVRDSHAVIQEAKDAGVYVFGGGIDEAVDPVLVAADGTVTKETTKLDGGYTVLDLPSHEAALEWAQKIAVSCRCPQEVRAFQYDPHS
ncbi:transcription initiation protein [Herbidospora galbida]|uniref:Transcription initiation protein n=1 Tax=Herbidospora galbida TaxID=2575442 RepID=A0A4U3M0Y5_9ACTN|nr:transcription initiation protein [Herbidospora galbida]TKK80797.1 transcription initiation protein [Herbidospora galbida]